MYKNKYIKYKNKYKYLQKSLIGRGPEDLEIEKDNTEYSIQHLNIDINGNLTIPDDIRILDKEFFPHDISMIKRINKFPDNLQEIREHFFENCTELTELPDFPLSLKIIGDYAFYNCIKLTKFPLFPSKL